MRSLRVHKFLPCSLSNGPGKRCVLWVQGCTLGCPGCFNPETHPFRTDIMQMVSVETVFEWIREAEGQVEGLSVLGGEPLQQRPALLELLRLVRERTRLSVLLFTGYTWEEMQHMRETPELLTLIDVLIAGRYDPSQRVAHGLIGSANKTVHFLTTRYTRADLEMVPTTEVIITPDGEVVLSGIEPLRWQAARR